MNESTNHTNGGGDARGHADHTDQHFHDVRRFFWRNYMAHSIEGGLFMGGSTFLAADSVMPAMIKSLGGPTWLISLMPMMMTLGFMMPQILTAHVVERLQWVKPFIMATGIVQRLPYAIAALGLYFLAITHPALVLALVALTPLFSGLAGGFSYGAWVELVSKVIPPERRASAWAIRYTLSAFIGIGAGSVIKDVLTDHPGPTGYALLHIIAFAFLAASFVIFAIIREVVPPRRRSSHRDLFENLRDMPDLLRRDPILRRFLCMRTLDTGVQIMVPFLGIHALAVTGRPESALGYLVTSQMTGMIIGNVLAGYLGDRHGGRILIIGARASVFAACVAATLAHAYYGFIAVYFLLGFGIVLSNIGIATLSIEIAPHERRPTYQALISLVVLPAALLSAFICTVVRAGFGVFAPAAFLAALTSVGSFIFLLKIPEPRHRADR